MFDSVNLNDFELPRRVGEDSEYVIDLGDCLKKYYEDLKAKIPRRSQCLSNVKENIDLIKSCLNNYYNVKIAEAYDNIKDILIKYAGGDKTSPFVVSVIDENYAFRGSAPSKLIPKIYDTKENDKVYKKMREYPLCFFKARIDEKSLNAKDMLHIPLNRREIIGTQRFSIPGIPCIYLSTTSYGTWIEMKCPKPNQFQVSSIKLPKDIRILNLCIQQHLINGKFSKNMNKTEENEALACIEIFPLVIATSYCVNQVDRKFKSEYIISQIVMQVCEELDIAGVAYLSTKTKDIYAYPQSVNLAIAIPNNEYSNYWKRADEVQLTKPVRYSEFLEMMEKNKEIEKKFLSYVNEIYKDDSDAPFDKIISEENREVKYIETNFSAFDEYILKQKFYPYKNL